MKPEAWIIWRYLTRFIDTHRYTPSQAQIARAYGIPAWQVQKHLNVLRENGCITWRPYEYSRLKLLIRPEEITGHEVNS